MPEIILGNGNAVIDYEVRHAIAFRAYSGKINLSDYLKSFYQFVYNPDKRRVSFVTEKNTNFRKPFSTEIFSTDSAIHPFNNEFLKLNPQIPFENIQTYEMKADPDDTRIYQIFNKETGDAFKGLTEYLPYYFAGSLAALWLWKKK